MEKYNLFIIITLTSKILNKIADAESKQWLWRIVRRTIHSLV